MASRSGGGSVYDPHNCNLEQGIYVKKHTKNMLVNVVGGINNPEDSDRLIVKARLISSPSPNSISLIPFRP